MSHSIYFLVYGNQSQVRLAILPPLLRIILDFLEKKSNIILWVNYLLERDIMLMIEKNPKPLGDDLGLEAGLGFYALNRLDIKTSDVLSEQAAGIGEALLNRRAADHIDGKIEEFSTEILRNMVHDIFTGLMTEVQQ